MMHHNPHEPGTRREIYAKDEADERLLTAVNEALQHADLPLRQAYVPIHDLPIIYIVGAPRSGTTLLSQLVSRYLPLGYINNLIARFWMRPSVGIRLSRAVLGEQAREGIVFRSTHGVSESVYGPHEFGYFWRHWLRLDGSPTHHLSPAALAQVDCAGLQHALEHEILGAFQTGVALKNVICGFHARFLTALHPASSFVHITRAPYEAAASILESRKARFGSYEVWWSLKPSTYPFQPRPGDPASEVARQVLDCRREMEEELSMPGVRAITVTYEDLCVDPKGVIHRICAGVHAMGAAMIHPVKADFPKLKASEPARLPVSLESRLRECLGEAA